MQASELISDSEGSEYTPPITPSSLAFTDFLIVGVSSSILNGNQSPLAGDQPLEVLERFAWGLEEGSENRLGLPEHLENITQFCFPHGGQLELAPISQVESFFGVEVILVYDFHGNNSNIKTVVMYRRGGGRRIEHAWLMVRRVCWIVMSY